MAVWFYQAIENDYFKVTFLSGIVLGTRKVNLLPELDTVYCKPFEVEKCCGFRGSIGTAKLFQ